MRAGKFERHVDVVVDLAVVLLLILGADLRHAVKVLAAVALHGDRTLVPRKMLQASN